MRTLLRGCVGEAAGTFLFVAIGTGTVAVAVFTDVVLALWQVAGVWGGGVAAAIYATRGLSGAHLNPVVTVAMALLRPASFPRKLAVPYITAQLVGAALAGAAVLLVFGGRIQDFEAANGLVRGSAGSELSAMAFGQYFPNPAVYDTGADARAMVSPLLAVSVEGLGTALLLLVVFALGDERWAARVSNAAPLLVGATVAVLIYLFAPLTQAGWNPARDLGPRLVAWMAGWGAIAIPGPAGGFWVYVTGPVAGGLLGAVGYHVLFRKGHAAPP